MCISTVALTTQIFNFIHAGIMLFYALFIKADDIIAYCALFVTLCVMS